MINNEKPKEFGQREFVFSAKKIKETKPRLETVF